MREPAYQKPRQNWILSLFLNFANLTGKKLYLVLICFPFIAIKIEHFFMHLQVIYNYSSVNCLFIPFAHFSPGAFLLIYDNCILMILALFIYVACIIFYFVICLLHIYFFLEKFYIFICLNILVFSLIISGFTPWLESSFHLKVWILIFKGKICVIYFFVCPKMTHTVLDLCSLIEERVTDTNICIVQADE